MKTNSYFVFVSIAFYFFCFSFSQPLSAQAGMLDSTFGIGGKVITDFGGDNDGIYSLSLWNGKIIAAGYTEQGENTDFAIMRYFIDGSIDTTFGDSCLL